MSNSPITVVCLCIYQSVQFSHSVVSDYLWPNGLQHARPPCPSTTPRVYPNSCPLSWWCHPTISSSVVPFSSCPLSFVLKEITPSLWLIWKDPNNGKDWGQEEKRTTEDEMAGWHHWLDGHEFGWALGVGDGQGGLACCSSWGCNESDTTEQLNWTGLDWSVSGEHGVRRTDKYICCQGGINGVTTCRKIWKGRNQSDARLLVWVTGKVVESFTNL